MMRKVPFPQRVIASWESLVAHIGVCNIRWRYWLVDSAANDHGLSVNRRRTNSPSRLVEEIFSSHELRTKLT